MNAGWIVAAIVALQFFFNVYSALRGAKLTKANIEKALYNNRQLLGQVLSDVAAQMTPPVPPHTANTFTPPVSTIPAAHSQAGESK